MDDMVRLAAGFGVKKLGFSLLHVQSEQCAALQMDEQQWAQLPALAQQAHALGKSLGVDTSAWTIAEAMQRRQTRTVSRSQCNPSDPFLTAGCYEPFLTATVVAEGYVGPCCAFWDESADNLGQASLKDIWTNPWFQRIRERLLTRDYPDFCAYCPSHFVWQTEEMRTDLEGTVCAKKQNEVRPFDASLIERFLSSLRQHGMAYTCRKSIEWVRATLQRTRKR